MNAAFLCGNSCDGLIEFHPGRTPGSVRALSRIGKFGEDDPDIDKFAGRWKRHGPDPARMMGARTTFPYNGTADWTCVNERHWLFAGTGMKNGDAIPGLVGWEHHGHPADPPGLEILADDVRCTHGATVGKLEQEPLFYLKSRGIPQAEAEKIVVEGFFDPIFQRIPFEGVRERFQQYIADKMAWL